jgi:hypothetical protein
MHLYLRSLPNDDCAPTLSTTEMDFTLAAL